LVAGWNGLGGHAGVYALGFGAQIAAWWSVRPGAAESAPLGLQHLPDVSAGFLIDDIEGHALSGPSSQLFN
jgi:hypothetical protein